MSDCSCVYVSESNEDWTRSEKICIARKDCKCEECNRTISKGDQYESVRWYGTESGHSHSKTCIVCREIRNTFFCNGYWAGMVLDNLFLHLEHVGGEVSSECIAGLSTPARERVCSMIEQVWEEMDEEDDRDCTENHAFSPLTVCEEG